MRENGKTRTLSPFPQIRIHCTLEYLITYYESISAYLMSKHLCRSQHLTCTFKVDKDRLIEINERRRSQIEMLGTVSDIGIVTPI